MSLAILRHNSFNQKVSCPEAFDKFDTIALVLHEHSGTSSGLLGSNKHISGTDMLVSPITLIAIFRKNSLSKVCQQIPHIQLNKTNLTSSENLPRLYLTEINSRNNSETMKLCGTNLTWTSQKHRKSNSARPY